MTPLAVPSVIIGGSSCVKWNLTKYANIQKFLIHLVLQSMAFVVSNILFSYIIKSYNYPIEIF